jgi:phage terminase small subunit
MPTAVLEARGSRHVKARKDKGELAKPPMANFPAPPERLPTLAAIVWETYGPQLVAASVMRPTDLLAFEALCHAWADYIAADDFLKRARHGIPDLRRRRHRQQGRTGGNWVEAMAAGEPARARTQAGYPDDARVRHDPKLPRQRTP